MKKYFLKLFPKHCFTVFYKYFLIVLEFYFYKNYPLSIISVFEASFIKKILLNNLCAKLKTAYSEIFNYWIKKNVFLFVFLEKNACKSQKSNLTLHLTLFCRRVCLMSYENHASNADFLKLANQYIYENGFEIKTTLYKQHFYISLRQ